MNNIKITKEEIEINGITYVPKRSENNIGILR